MADLKRLVERSIPKPIHELDFAVVREEQLRYFLLHGTFHPHLNAAIRRIADQSFRGFAERFAAWIDSEVESGLQKLSLTPKLGWVQGRHISQWPRANGSRPSFENLVRLAVLLDWSPTWMMLGAGPQRLSDISMSERKNVDSLSSDHVSSPNPDDAVEWLRQALRQATKSLGEETVLAIVREQRSIDDDRRRVGFSGRKVGAGDRTDAARSKSKRVRKGKKPPREKT